MNYEKNFKDDYEHIVSRYNELCEVVDDYEHIVNRYNEACEIVDNYDTTDNLIKIMETRADTEGIAL